MKFSKVLLYTTILFISASIAKSQALGCPDFSIISAFPDTNNVNTYQFSIQSAGTTSDFTNYPLISAVLDCNGDTVAIGGLFWFGQLGQTIQDYPVTLTGNGSINCYPLTALFVINSNQGVSDTCQLILSTTAVTFSNQNTEVPLLFPNPFSEEVNLSVDEKFIGSKYYILDYLGRIVQTGLVYSNNNTLNLNNLSQGVYILTIGEQKSKSIKFIKK